MTPGAPLLRTKDTGTPFWALLTTQRTPDTDEGTGLRQGMPQGHPPAGPHSTSCLGRCGWQPEPGASQEWWQQFSVTPANPQDAQRVLLVPGRTGELFLG